MADEIVCKACGAAVAPDAVDRELSVARCEACGAVFGVTADGGAEASPARPQVGMPKGMEVLDIGQALQITWRWFGAKYLGLLFFCIFWNGFMIAWHTIAISQGAWFMSLFGLIHTAVGVVLGYVTLAGLLNRTTLRAGGGVLEIHHAPLPWPNNHLTLTAEDLRQLYVKEKVSRGNNNSVSRSYSLSALHRVHEASTPLTRAGPADPRPTGPAGNAIAGEPVPPGRFGLGH